MSTATDTVRPGSLHAGGLRRVVIVLSITEITSWGVLYYAFPVLASSIVQDTSWSMPAITAAFSVSQIVAAVVGIPVGRIIDRRGPRAVMTIGSMLGVLSVLVIASAPSYPIFFLGWVCSGVAMAGVLYAPAFAALTHWGGAQRIRALTTLTLVAGLASTVFAPLTAALNHHLDWRQTYLILLVILTVVTIPAHWFGLRHRWIPHPTPGAGPASAGPRSVITSRAFVLLAVALCAAAFTTFAVVINLVPLLVERGLSTGEAAVALGLGGVGQVAGRLGYSAFAARTSVVARTVIICGAVAVSTALLAVVPGPMVVLITISMIVGVVRGITTLIQATAVSDRWGTRGFGRINGVLSAPILVAAAVAPFAGAALAESVGGQGPAFLILSLIAVVAALAAIGTRPRAEQEDPCAVQS